MLLHALSGLLAVRVHDYVNARDRPTAIGPILTQLYDDSTTANTAPLQALSGLVQGPGRSVKYPIRRAQRSKAKIKPRCVGRMQTWWSKVATRETLCDYEIL